MGKFLFESEDLHIDKRLNKDPDNKPHMELDLKNQQMILMFMTSKAPH